MFNAEQIFQSLTYKELYLTLKSLTEEDCYLSEYLDNDLAENFLYLLEVYDLIRIASDDRILLTLKGEKVLQNLILPVEISKNYKKVPFDKKL